MVDPGVGTAPPGDRGPGGRALFVGPDNGLFTFALEGAGWTAVSLTAPEYRLAEVSRTFHGRDVFAPAAAYLASGVPLERLGPVVSDPERLRRPGCRLEGGELVGEVLDADRFGNLITSIPAARLAEIRRGRAGSRWRWRGVACAGRWAPTRRAPRGSRRSSSARRGGWRSS